MSSPQNQDEEAPTETTTLIAEHQSTSKAGGYDYTKFAKMVSHGFLILSVGIATALLLQHGRHGISPSPYVVTCKAPCVSGDESIMSLKEHGTSSTPVQSNLRWGCDSGLADRLCNFNRHWAEPVGYWLQPPITLLSNIQELQSKQEDMESNNSYDKQTNTTKLTFYDSNTGNPLFRTPIDRSWQDFVDESTHHGWPSFRDEEVNWDYVRVLRNGETVSIDGTHLGHNLPDSKGNRYCINLVSIAGRPTNGGDAL